MLTRRKRKRNHKGRADYDAEGRAIEIKVRPFEKGHRATVYVDGKPSGIASSETHTCRNGVKFTLKEAIREAARWFSKMGGTSRHMDDIRHEDRERKKEKTLAEEKKEA